MEPITVTCFCHNSCCLLYVMSLASLYFRKHISAYRSRRVFNINISQGSVSTPLKCGETEICNNCFIAHFIVSVTMEEF